MKKPMNGGRCDGGGKRSPTDRREPSANVGGDGGRSVGRLGRRSPLPPRPGGTSKWILYKIQNFWIFWKIRR